MITQVPLSMVAPPPGGVAFEALIASLNRRYGETKSASDFGAVGNGVADDTAAIAAALASFSVFSGLLHCPGRYRITAGLTVPANVTLIGNGRNNITHWSVDFVPSLTSGGTAPSLGNGTLTGSASRCGNMVNVSIELIVGSTTTLGTGDLRFGLPSWAPNNNEKVQICGTALCNIGGTSYTAAVQLAALTQFVQLIRDTSGAVTASSPAAFASGSIIWLAFTYRVG